MRFTDEEIILARKLRDEGLPWEPAAGHYVYDETGFCKQSSPFQDRVYFILNYSYFMKAVGGVERFKDIMIWLPTWYDAREILRNYRVSDQQIREHLFSAQAIERGTERLSLYELIASQISTAPCGR
jgi:hypothetical protein